MDEKWITEDWNELKTLLPENWEDNARALGALRRTRNIKTAEQLLRYILLHVGAGLSLKQSVARAREQGLPKMSAVGLMQRLRGSEAWLRCMSNQLLEQRGLGQQWARLPEGYRVMAVDSSVIRETGQTGSEWRLHYALELPGLFCTHAELTEANQAENLAHYSVGKNDLLLGDRNYCKAPQINHVIQAGSHVVLRWHRGSAPLRDASGRAFDVAGWLRKIKAKKYAEAPVRLAGVDAPLRLCAVRTNAKAAARERERLTESARKNGREVGDESLFYADYIIVLTSLPREEVSTMRVLMLYRLRWQIELAFKRLKSLLDMGQVPKTQDDSVRAWMQAKILTSLLIEQLLLEAEVFSPWGFVLAER